jgi:hypothetical protein
LYKEQVCKVGQSSVSSFPSNFPDFPQEGSFHISLGLDILLKKEERPSFLWSNQRIVF